MPAAPFPSRPEPPEPPLEPPSDPLFQYRFGTDATSYQVRGLRQGVLPVGAGLGHHLVQCSTTDGVALARFLAISEKRLDAEEMFELGMVTHMADDESPQDIANGLAWTRPKDMDFTQAEQVAMDTDLIEEVLETINAESEDIEETYQDELWDDLLSIPPKAVDEIEDAETVDGYPRIESKPACPCPWSHCPVPLPLR